jgi:ketosteroid isomerase-like protein
MSLEDNKKVVRSYCDALSAGDIEGCLALTTDDYYCWVPGDQKQIPVCGTNSKSDVTTMYAAWPTMFPKGFTVIIKSMTAEEDRVAVEATSYGETPMGKLYEQTYHYLFKVRDGKIAVQHEYLDTLHLKQRMVDDFADILEVPR